MTREWYYASYFQVFSLLQGWSRHHEEPLSKNQNIRHLLVKDTLIWSAYIPWYSPHLVCLGGVWSPPELEGQNSVLFHAFHKRSRRNKLSVFLSVISLSVSVLVRKFVDLFSFLESFEEKHQKKSAVVCLLFHMDSRSTCDFSGCGYGMMNHRPELHS